MKKIISILILLCLVTTTRAQSVYEYGIFGTLHEPKLKKVYATTRYNGWQSFMATVYLPYMPDEWEPSSGKDPHDVCNKAIVLYAPKSEQDGVYAPVEVIGSDDSEKTIPFIDYVGKIDYQDKYISKFEDFPYMNSSFQNPFESKDAAGVMEAIQKFNKWTYEMFGWKGLDKEGNAIIRGILQNLTRSYYSAEDNHIFINVSNTFKYESQASRDVIGHEITHGIAIYSHEESIWGTELREIDEGFCNVMGVAFANFTKPQFDPIGHFPTHTPVEEASDNFRYPKLTNGASAYKGVNYKIPGSQGYDEHNNGAIISHCFFIMVNGKLGFVDENLNKGVYNVLPLDMNDKKTSWTIGINLFFRTFTEKLTIKSGYFDFREKMLEQAVEMGYPVGSHVYIQVMNAWNAVGVGEDWNPGRHNADCVAGQGRLAESLHNGIVEINTTRATATKDPQSLPMYILEDCGGDPWIKTKPLLSPQEITYEDTLKDANGKPLNIFVIESPDYKKFRAIDLDDDGVYTLDNDIKMSKSLVSIHWASRMTASYYSARYQYYGIDGKGDLEVQNHVGDPSTPFKGFNSLDTIFYYSNGDGQLDNISKNYTQAIYHLALGHKGADNDSPEAAGIKIAFSNIMALGIKKEVMPNLVFPKNWEIDDDVSKWDFLDPKSAGQAVYYKGQNYDITKPETVSGVMNYWYGLLVRGTTWQEPNGWQNEVGDYCSVVGIDQSLAEKIVFLALTKYLPNPTFEQMRIATQLAVTDGLGYAKNSPAYIAVTDAWNAVGVGLPYNTDLVYSPKDKSKNIYPLPIDLSIETEYPQYEDLRLFELSTSPFFDDKVAEVWRAASYKSDILVPFTDENHPGKTISHARFYMEPGRKYYWRSRLLSVKAAECPPQNNPESLCNQLVVKKKWSPTYELETGPFVAETVSPFSGQNNVHPWPQKFAYKTNKGLVKTEIQVQEVNNPAVMIEMSRDPEELADPAAPQKFTEVTKVLTDYQWRVRDVGPKMGSPEGLDNHYNHIGQTGLPVVTEWSNNGQFIPYKTTKPQGIQLAPADNIKVAPFGQDVVFSWQAIEGAAMYSLDFSLDPKFVVAIKKFAVVGNASTSYTLNQMPTFQNGAVIYWRIVPIGPTGTYVPNAQGGTPSTLRKITIDHSLIPAVTLVGPMNIVDVRFGANFSWKAVPGAAIYQYEVQRTFDDQYPANGKGETPQTSIILTDLDFLPPGMTGGYRWRVRAGAKDPQTQQYIFGNWSPLETYKLQPRHVHITSPDDNSDGDETTDLPTTVTFSAEQEIEWAPSGYQVLLRKDGSEIVLDKIIPTLEDFQVSGLAYGTEYKVQYNPMNEEVSNFSSAATFHTKKAPNASPFSDLGFSLDFYDYEFPNNFTFVAKVTIKAPDGTLAYEFDHIVSNTQGIWFLPGPWVTGVYSNGNLPDMNGIYLVDVEIVELKDGFDENFAADVKFALTFYGGNPDTLEIKPLTPQPFIGALGGRWVGCSMENIQFNYKFP